MLILLASLLILSSGDKTNSVKIKFSSVLNSIKVNPKTGELLIDHLLITVIDKKNDKITAKLLKNGKMVSRFLFRVSQKRGSFYQISMVKRKVKGFNNTYTKLNSGTYSLNFEINNTQFFKFPFEIESISDSQGQIYYFINGYWAQYTALDYSSSISNIRVKCFFRSKDVNIDRNRFRTHVTLRIRLYNNSELVATTDKPRVLYYGITLKSSLVWQTWDIPIYHTKGERIEKDIKPDEMNDGDYKLVIDYLKTPENLSNRINQSDIVVLKTFEYEFKLKSISLLSNHLPSGSFEERNILWIK